MKSSSSSDNLEGIQEDNDPTEEFEQKVQESYQIHKDTSRPTSSTSNRPQTASRHREEQGRITSVSPVHIYAKIIDSLENSSVSKQELLNSVGDYATAEGFKQGLLKLNIELNEEEISAVFRDHGVNPRGGVLRLQDFLGKVFKELREISEEPHLPTEIPPELVREAKKLLEESHPRLARQLKQKKKSDKTLRRPVSGTLQSGASSRAPRPMSAYAGTRRSKNTEIQTQRLPKDYLQQSKNRQTEIDKELALTVEKCKREFEYDCLHKMGEANEIAQNTGLTITYRAIKKDDGKTKCYIFDNDQFIEEITLENFLREWRKLKRRQKPAINLLGGASAPQAPTGPNPNVPASAKVNKKERQEELKKLLLETKELTNKLKEQLKILEKKGIISKSIHSSSAGYSANFF